MSRRRASVFSYTSVLTKSALPSRNERQKQQVLHDEAEAPDYLPSLLRLVMHTG